VLATQEAKPGRVLARLKNAEERDRFLRAALSVGEHVHALYATGVFTGMRAGELAGLRRENIDLARRIINVSRSFDGPTKNGETRHVLIVDALLPILERWLSNKPLPLVFPNAAGNMLQPSAWVFQEVLDAN
jgi:integrase